VFLHESDLYTVPSFDGILRFILTQIKGVRLMATSTPLEYWPLSHVDSPLGFSMEARALLAWELLLRVGICTGTPQGEDSAGRSVLSLLPPQDLVDRAFQIADSFVNKAEARRELKGITEDDTNAVYNRGGDLERIKSDAMFPNTGRSARRKTNFHDEATVDSPTPPPA
jgi:hypothetical protein